ncbi:phenylacetate--CoA ligase family protein [Acinetobacter indicus]|uniref:Phenylacetate--CoA ligase family protein n=1 Tax=Acinetobacter indicus TaxID=756892 RepID=A0A6C0Y5U4_9GAMM|nr:phenylacetate--CoA ligase family protein [Acinetobacter indicus]QIC71523.1 phenylacetate--CoA ligase family protein [Acinetobacter indicus]
MNLKSYFLRKYFWLNDFFHGQPIRKQYRDIASIIERKKGYKVRQQLYLKKILSHAIKNTAFYSQYETIELSRFPVVNKNILRENYNDLCVGKENIPCQKDNVFIQKTSGSTGTPFAVPQSSNKRERRLAELKYFGDAVGFKSHEKLVHLRVWNNWRAKTKKQIFWENIIPFDISKMDDASLKDLCNVIVKEKAHTVRGYASSLDMLAQYAKCHKISFPQLKLMIAGSEALQDSTRDVVAELGVDIISQYANEENGILAQEYPKQPKKIFFLNDASYVFEILKLGSDLPAERGELGRIVITDLFNYAFPMIRYDTGDVGVFGEKDGRKVLTALYGRRIDLVYDINGSVISPMSLTRIFKDCDYIQQWQFLQQDEKEYEIRLVLTDNADVSIELKRELQLLLGEHANVVFTLVQDIPLLDSRKRKPVVNLWKK